MFKHSIRYFLTAVLFTIYSATGLAEAAPMKTKLALNWKPEPEFGGFYEAQVGGFFKKENIDAEILAGGAGTPVVQMVAAGQMDFGISSADEVIISRSHGSDVVAIFATYQTNPQAIMTHAERKFKSIADVFNREGTVAMESGMPYALYLKKKYTYAAVHIVPYLGGIQDFLGDPNFSQQCYSNSEPLLAKSKGQDVKTFMVADSGFNPYTTVLITREEVIKKNPELVKHMVAAVKAGWAAYQSNPDPANQFMADLNKAMDPATFKAAAEAQRPLIENKDTKKSGIGSMTEQRWKQLSHQLLELKLIDKESDAKTLFAKY
jgi:NitT/TauT family transport system substrate-binding protein